MEAIEEGKDTSAATFNVVRSYLSGPSSFGIDKNDLVLSKWVSDTYLKVGAEYGVFGKDDMPDEERIDASSLLTGKVGNVENLEERSMLKSSQSRYGLLPTLYFHLLKGPLGSQIRAFGDIVAWTSAFVARRISATSRFVKRLSRRPRSRRCPYWLPRHPQRRSSPQKLPARCTPSPSGSARTTSATRMERFSDTRSWWRKTT